MEFELEKLKIHGRANFVQNVTNLLSTIVIAIGFFSCAYMVMNGLIEISKNNPESIGALSKVIDSLHLDKISGALVGLLGSGYGIYERKGKKRAIAQVAELREKVEALDSYRGSSNLTRSGDSRKNKGEK